MTAKGKKQVSTRKAPGKDDIAIGGRIRAMRMNRSVTQEGLAKALGLSFQQVQKYEKGVNRVSMVRGRQIAAVLETTTEELFGGDLPGGDGMAFDTESYKLARSFAKLPSRLKIKFRNLIDAVTEEAEK